jgi:hypothetical protein
LQLESQRHDWLAFVKYLDADFSDIVVALETNATVVLWIDVTLVHLLGEFVGHVVAQSFAQEGLVPSVEPEYGFLEVFFCHVFPSKPTTAW